MFDVYICIYMSMSMYVCMYVACEAGGGSGSGCFYAIQPPRGREEAAFLESAATDQPDPAQSGYRTQTYFGIPKGMCIYSYTTRTG